jgi:hypothetical protein
MTRKEQAKQVVAHKALKEFLAGHEDEAKEGLLVEMSKGDRIGVADDDGTDLGTVTYSSGNRTPKVTNEAAFVAWVAANRPDEVIETTRRTVRPAFVSLVLKWTKDNGVAVTPEGEPIPGIELHAGNPYLTVKTTDEAKERTRIALGATMPELTAGGE